MAFELNLWTREAELTMMVHVYVSEVRSRPGVCDNIAAFSDE